MIRSAGRAFLQDDFSIRRKNYLLHFTGPSVIPQKREFDKNIFRFGVISSGTYLVVARYAFLDLPDILVSNYRSAKCKASNFHFAPPIPVKAVDMGFAILMEIGAPAYLATIMILLS